MMRQHHTHWGLWLGAALLAGICLPAVVAVVLFGNHAPAIDIPHRYEAPTLAHPLGTDPFGRDILAYVLTGAFNSVLIAAIAVAIATFLGTLMGLLAAIGRQPLVLSQSPLPRRFSAPIEAFADLALAFPPILTAAIVVVALGASASEEIAALAIFTLPSQIRLTKQAASTVLRREYVAAARIGGRTTVQIVLTHVLPNILPQLLVQASSAMAVAILSDAGLSYLGLGMPPPRPDLGRALSSYQIHIADHPMLVAVPGLAIMLLVLGFNLFGDGLRDRFDRTLAEN